jgi:hypothetical protein
VVFWVEEVCGTRIFVHSVLNKMASSHENIQLGDRLGFRLPVANGFNLTAGCFRW